MVVVLALTQDTILEHRLHFALESPCLEKKFQMVDRGGMMRIGEWVNEHKVVK